MRIYIVSPSSASETILRNLAENVEIPHTVCGSARETKAALSDLLELQPDILLMDAQMPGLDKRTFAELANQVAPNLRIVAAQDVRTTPRFEIENQPEAAASEDLADVLRIIPASAAPPDAHPNLAYRLYQQIMRHVFYGQRTTAELLEDAALLDLPLKNAFYQAAVLHLHVTQPSETILICAMLRRELVPASRLLYFYDEHDQLLILVQAESLPSLQISLQEAAESVRTALKSLNLVVTTVFGEPVVRLDDLPAAAADAIRLVTQIQRLCPGLTIDIDKNFQQASSALSWSDSFASRCESQLLHADEADAPSLLQSFLQRLDEVQLDNFLYRYYLLMDILHSAVRVAAADSERSIQQTAADFGNLQQILAAAATRSAFEASALLILQKAIRLRDDLSPEMRRENVIQRAARFIQNNYGDSSMSLQQVAKHAGFSSTHFSTVFSKKMGCTFIEYLTRLRMKRAKELLAETDSKLAEIAMEIGYNDPNYFSHVFRKREGISPREYRLQAAAEPPSSTS